MTSDWYSVVSGGDLEQGDVIVSCPVHRVESDDDSDEAVVIREEHDVVLLTQTCDLEHDKVEDVLVGVIVSYGDLVAREETTNGKIRSKEFRKAAAVGNLPPYFVLPERDQAPVLPWSLVQFHYVFSVPKPVVTALALAQPGRLRLNSPYKEYLAQAFARFIMRVALPSTLDEFAAVTPSAQR